MDWQDQLISLYVYISKNYNHKLKFFVERNSNHSDLRFSDEEVMTIYIFGTHQNRRNLKEIYAYTRNHLQDWFPHLPSYVAFVQRLNKISHLLTHLTEDLHKSLIGLVSTNLGSDIPRVIDAMPIILAHRGRRFNAKVAPEIATKNGYCATKKLYYYGVKLHVMGLRIKGGLPIPEYFGITEAGTADIRVAEAICDQFPDYQDQGKTRVFADKAYQKESKPILENENSVIHTPVKKQKHQTTLDAADKLLSSAISSIRQPIESFFNWINEKTNIQIASKVRSYNGLMVHVCGKMAAAIFLLIGRLGV